MNRHPPGSRLILEGAVPAALIALTTCPAAPAVADTIHVPADLLGLRDQGDRS